MVRQSFFVSLELALSMYLVLIWRCRSSEKADLVIRNGTVYTVDATRPVAEAVAVVDGKIAFVGSSEKAQVWIGGQTDVLDLRGKTMTPGFIDTHNSIIWVVGFEDARLDLKDTKSYIGHGWHQDNWQSPLKPNVRGFPFPDGLSQSVA